jgi:hypothetical protein
MNTVESAIRFFFEMEERDQLISVTFLMEEMHEANAKK